MRDHVIIILGLNSTKVFLASNLGIRVRTWKKYNKCGMLGKGTSTFSPSCISPTFLLKLTVSLTRDCCISIMGISAISFVPSHRKWRSKFSRLMIDIPEPESPCDDPEWLLDQPSSFYPVCSWLAIWLLSGFGVWSPVLGISENKLENEDPMIWKQAVRGSVLSSALNQVVHSSFFFKRTLHWES